MEDSSYPNPEESAALGTALNHFLFDRIEEGKAELLRVRTASLDRVYTAGLRLGIEAHALANQRRG
jgi:hypothetical protein